MLLELDDRGFQEIDLEKCQIHSGAGGHALIVKDDGLDDGRCRIKVTARKSGGVKQVVRNSRIRNGRSTRIKIAQKHEPVPKLISVKIKYLTAIADDEGAHYILDDEQDAEVLNHPADTAPGDAADPEDGGGEILDDPDISIQSGTLLFDLQLMPSAGKAVAFGLRAKAGNFAKSVSGRVSANFTEVKGGRCRMKRRFSWWSGTGRVTFLKSGDGSVLASATIVRPKGDKDIFSLEESLTVRE